MRPLEFWLGPLYVAAGGCSVRKGRVWLPDGLHVWWGNRGVHLFWSKSEYAPRVMWGRWES